MNDFSKLQKKIRLNKKLCNFNYRGERVFIVLSGINHANYDMTLVPGLKYYEERMLFFLFLLRYKYTKIVYVTSNDFDKKLLNYYIDLVAKNPKDFNNKKSRLIHIEVKDDRNIALSQKILESKETIEEIKKHVEPKTTVLRCYNPTQGERELALKLNAPIFSSLEKYDFVGTKTGGRRVFKEAKTNLIPGYSNLKSIDQLFSSMAKLIKDYPRYQKLVVKLNSTASGSGNLIFRTKDFLDKNKIDRETISKTTLIENIKMNFEQFAVRQEVGPTFDQYYRLFDQMGGIVEVFIDGKVKFSPSVQAFISAEGRANIISTHEQILGGVDKQEYLGCSFPSKESHRKIIIKEARKIAEWMAKKGMMGNFGIDFVVVYPKEANKPIVHPIEINLRKGGTTHPFRIAYFLTGAKYNQAKGLLMCGKMPIYYRSMDVIRSEKYKGIKADDLVELVHNSKLNFNKNTKKGVLIYMPGVIEKYNFFGAISIGHNSEEARRIYNKMIKLIDSKLELLKN